MPNFSSAQRMYIRKQTKEVHLDPSEAAGELNIIPFLDIVVNLIMFLLVVTSTVMTFYQLDANLPAYGRGVGGQSDEPENTLNLMVTVVDEGVIVTGGGGKLAPGCEGTQGGRVITVPKTGAGYNWASLTTCLTTVHRQYADNDRVILTANPDVHYQHLVHAMDAINDTEAAAGGKQLPNILLSGGVR